jgi:Ran GTPase-activating protein (RanGAP) involved in mRNA processing and transport
MAILHSERSLAYFQSFATKKFKGIQAICAWGINLGDSGVKFLAESLSLLPFCKKLELTNCGLTEQSAIYLGNALKHRNSAVLTILRLDNNINFTTKGLNLISSALQFNSTLTTLSLANCGLDYGAGEIISRILSFPDIKLRQINLERNQLENNGLLLMAPGVKINNSLVSLNLNNNNISGETNQHNSTCLAVFFSAVMAAKTLTKLQFDGNLIGNAGLKLILALLNSAENRNWLSFTVSPFVDKEIYNEFCGVLEKNTIKPVKKKKKRVKKESRNYSLYSTRR